MKTTEIKIYEFKELSEKVQQKVLENFRYFNVDDDYWCEYLKEDFKEKLENIGIDNVVIYYSGFCTQGDGASFTGDLDIKKVMEHFKLNEKYPIIYQNGEDIIFKVIHNDSRYYHHNTMGYRLRFDSYDLEDIITEKDNLEDFISEINYNMRELAKEFYKQLETEFYNAISDENVIASIEANEYMFLINGEVFHNDD